ncbi:hypothetical protein FB645_004479 [Coemansia sp. IMI 203386]|nr:hypothetical protein FB645_004479 [Coemansia sp. IMI 203386]
MSSLEAIQTLNQLMKRAPSKRIRKERSKQNVAAFIRRTTTKDADKPAAGATTRVEKPKRQASKNAVKSVSDEAAARLRRNTKTLLAANKLINRKSKVLEQEVLELLDAQRERRMPIKKEKKAKMPFFDFEDLD